MLPGMSVEPVTPRLVYFPASQTSAPAVATHPLRALAGYYRDPLSWRVLAFTTVVLCYGGGLAMFWYHSFELGEGGPQISWQVHWLLDSTFAFVLLTPVLAVILPAAGWAARSLAGSRPILPWLYAGLAGLAFALVTTPGPVAHDLIVGRGTWAAQRVTEWLGDPSAPLRPTHEYAPLVALTQQLGFGLPLYVVLMLLTVLATRAALAKRPA
jgi:hypothetical protein